MGGKKERVIEAATRLFFQQGITATSMEQIAENVPVSKMTVYNYFQSKERLLELVLDRYIGQVLQELREMIVNAEDPLEAMMNMAQKRGAEDMTEGFVRELVEGYPRISAKLLQFQKETMGPELEKLIFRCQQEGRVRRELSPHVVLLVIQAVKEYFSRAEVWRDLENMRWVSEQIMTILYHGILTDSGESAGGSESANGGSGTCQR